MYKEVEYEDIFSEDSVLSISKEDFNLIKIGKNPFISVVILDDIDNASKCIKESFKNLKEGMDCNDNAIIYIKAKENLTLIDQAKIIEEIRNNFKVELNVIYGVAINDKFKDNITIYIISSKNELCVA